MFLLHLSNRRSIFSKIVGCNRIDDASGLCSSLEGGTVSAGMITPRCLGLTIGRAVRLRRRQTSRSAMISQHLNVTGANRASGADIRRTLSGCCDAFRGLFERSLFRVETGLASRSVLARGIASSLSAARISVGAAYLRRVFPGLEFVTQNPPALGRKESNVRRLLARCRTASQALGVPRRDGWRDRPRRRSHKLRPMMLMEVC